MKMAVTITTKQTNSKCWAVSVCIHFSACFPFADSIAFSCCSDRGKT